MVVPRGHLSLEPCLRTVTPGKPPPLKGSEFLSPAAHDVFAGGGLSHPPPPCDPTGAASTVLDTVLGKLVLTRDAGRGHLWGTVPTSPVPGEGSASAWADAPARQLSLTSSPPHITRES